jgi:hypothetical protein
MINQRLIMVGINSSSFYLPKLTIKKEVKKEFPT